MRYNEDTEQLETTTEEIAYITKGASLIEDLIRISLAHPHAVKIAIKIEGITELCGEVELPPEAVAGITIAVMEGIKKADFAIRLQPQ